MIDREPLTPGTVLRTKFPDVYYTVNKCLAAGGGSLIYSVSKSNSKAASFIMKEVFPKQYKGQRGLVYFKRDHRGYIVPDTKDVQDYKRGEVYFSELTKLSRWENEIGQSLRSNINVLASIEDSGICSIESSQWQEPVTIDKDVFVFMDDASKHGLFINQILNEAALDPQPGFPLRRGGYPHIHHTANIMVRILTELCSLHNAGYIHGDIQTGNIFLLGSNDKGHVGEAFFLDLATVRKVEDSGHTGDLSEEMLFSTPGYIPPEFEVHDENGHKYLYPVSDLYSVACLFLKMMGLSEDRLIELRKKHELSTYLITKRIAKGIGAVPEVVDLINNILQQALAENPAKRFLDAKPDDKLCGHGRFAKRMLSMFERISVLTATSYFERFINSYSASNLRSKNPFHYSYSAFDCYGRQKEYDFLESFLNDSGNMQVRWTAITGAAGTGKSKLIYSFMNDNSRHPDWKVVLLRGSDIENLARLSDISYPKNLLLVFDYIEGYAEKIGKWYYDLSNKQLANKIYIILLERNGQINGSFSQLEMPWMEQFRGKTGQNGFINRTEYQLDGIHTIYELEPPEKSACEEIIWSFLQHKGDKVTCSMVDKIYERAAEIDNKYSKPRPIILIFCAEAFSEGRTVFNQVELVSYIRNKILGEWETGLFVVDGKPNKELAAAVENLLLFATACGEIDVLEENVLPAHFENSRKTLLKYMKKRSDVKTLVAAVNMSQDASSILKPLEPDLIGENYCLEFFTEAAEEDELSKVLNDIIFATKINEITTFTEDDDRTSLSERGHKLLSFISMNMMDYFHVPQYASILVLIVQHIAKNKNDDNVSFFDKLRITFNSEEKLFIYHNYAGGIMSDSDRDKLISMGIQRYLRQIIFSDSQLSDKELKQAIEKEILSIQKYYADDMVIAEIYALELDSDAKFLQEEVENSDIYKKIVELQGKYPTSQTISGVLARIIARKITFSKDCNQSKRYFSELYKLVCKYSTNITIVNEYCYSVQLLEKDIFDQSDKRNHLSVVERLYYSLPGNDLLARTYVKLLESNSEILFGDDLSELVYKISCVYRTHNIFKYNLNHERNVWMDTDRISFVAESYATILSYEKERNKHAAVDSIISYLHGVFPENEIISKVYYKSFGKSFVRKAIKGLTNKRPTLFNDDVQVFVAEANKGDYNSVHRLITHYAWYFGETDNPNRNEAIKWIEKFLGFLDESYLESSYSEKHLAEIYCAYAFELDRDDEWNLLMSEQAIMYFLKALKLSANLITIIAKYALEDIKETPNHSFDILNVAIPFLGSYSKEILDFIYTYNEGNDYDTDSSADIFVIPQNTIDEVKNWYSTGELLINGYQEIIQYVQEQNSSDVGEVIANQCSENIKLISQIISEKAIEFIKIGIDVENYSIQER